MNSGSSTMFRPAEMSIVHMATFAFPSARTTALVAMANMKNIVPIRMMRR